MQIHVMVEGVLLREPFRTFGAGERSDFFVNRPYVILQRRISRQLHVADVANGFELMMIEIVRCPFLLSSVASIAQIARRFSSRRLYEVIVSDFTGFAFEAVLVAFQLTLVCEILVAIRTAHVRFVVNCKSMVVERSSVREDYILTKVTLPRLSYFKMYEVHVLVQRELMSCFEFAFGAS